MHFLTTCENLPSCEKMRWETDAFSHNCEKMRCLADIEFIYYFLKCFVDIVCSVIFELRPIQQNENKTSTQKIY